MTNLLALHTHKVSCWYNNMVSLLSYGCWIWTRRRRRTILPIIAQYIYDGEDLSHPYVKSTTVLCDMFTTTTRLHFVSIFQYFSTSIYYLMFAWVWGSSFVLFRSYGSEYKNKYAACTLHSTEKIFTEPCKFPSPGCQLHLAIYALESTSCLHS